MSQDLRTTRCIQLTEGLQVVPATLTDLTTTTTWVEQITVANIDASICTLLVQDKQGTPLELVPTVSLGANSTSLFSFPKPVKMLGGMSWQAGTSNKLRAEVKGYRLP